MSGYEELASAYEESWRVLNEGADPGTYTLEIAKAERVLRDSLKTNPYIRMGSWGTCRSCKSCLGVLKVHTEFRVRNGRRWPRVGIQKGRWILAQTLGEHASTWLELNELRVRLLHAKHQAILLLQQQEAAQRTPYVTQQSTTPQKAEPWWSPLAALTTVYVLDKLLKVVESRLKRLLERSGGEHR